MKKKIVALMLGLFAALSLGACRGMPEESGGGSGETVKLTLWGPTEHQKMLGEMVETFKKENAGTRYEITLAVVSEADAYKTIGTDVSAGADVYAFANDQINNLYHAGALAKLGGNHLEKMLEENGEGAVNAAKIADGYYGYPFTADNGYFLYYDKSVVSSPDTLEGLLSDLGAKNKKLVIDLDEPWYTSGFFFGTGCRYEVTYGDNGKESAVTCDFDDPVKGVAAGKAMIALNAHDAFLNGGDDELKAGFAGGSVGAAVSGTWNAEAIENALGENYAAAKLPTFTVDGQTYQLSSFAGYKLYGVNPTSKYLAHAHRLAAFLSGEEMQLKRFEDVAAGPSNVNAAKSEKVQANVALAALSAQGQFAVAQTAVPTNFFNAVEAFGVELTAGKVTASNLSEKLAVMTADIKTITAKK
ncbi:MAG: extracellular solute-binding protein [Clostridia bacterium]|nr:extracellular solute-binding protein [Clostridia bacterium]